MSETNGSSAGRRGRRKFSAAGQAADCIGGLAVDTKISELCRREGISATQFYQWKDRLLGSAAKVFEDKASGPSVQEEQTAAQLGQDEGRDRRDHGRERRLKKTLSD